MLRGMHSGRRKKAVGERRERGAGGGFGAVRRDLGGRDRKSRGCAGRSTPEAKQTWSRTHQESGVIFAVPGFSCPLRLSLSHCGNGHLLPRIPVSHGRESPHASAYFSPFLSPIPYNSGKSPQDAISSAAANFSNRVFKRIRQSSSSASSS